MKRQVSDWEKYLQATYLEKDKYLEYRKELPKLNSLKRIQVENGLKT